MLCSPTGGGKTVMAFALMNSALSRGNKCIFYTHRTMLFDQMVDRFRAAGFNPALRAPGRPWDMGEDVCLAMIQTDYARCIKTQKSELFDAQVVVVDEAHAHKGKTAVALSDKHIERGATIVGLSATPVAVSHLYDDWVEAGNYTDMLTCGLHLPVELYAPSEPDLKGVKAARGEFEIEGLEKRFQPHVICGDIRKYYDIYNPERKPTLLYAPSVPGSIGITNDLNSHGIRTAHLDGGSALLPDGTEVRSSRHIRDDLCDDLLSGRIDIISNRFVLREGIDLPQLYMGILATSFGLVSYIQSTGRLMRAHPTLDHVRFLDFGGNYYRHGYPNINREWDISNGQVRQPAPPSEDVQGWRCPNCTHINKKKGICEQCGHEVKRLVRAVRSIDGELTLKPQRKPLANCIQEWNQTWFQMLHSKKTMPLYVVAEWFTKRTGHVIDRTGEVTRIRAKDGTVTILRRAPAPDSEAWRRPVYQIDPEHLQWGL